MQSHLSSHPSQISRRHLLTAAAGAAGLGTAGAFAAGSCPAAQSKLAFDNASFYLDGKFQVEKAKDAILALCQYHGYPVFPKLREQLWISDYGVGQFAKLGLAGCVFVNNVKDRYMMLDIYLLPGQMLPEHWHVDGEGNPAKREGWLVRHGLSHIGGIGEPNLGKDVAFPSCHSGGKVTVEHEVVATPGMFVPLAEVESRHWQLAGPEGAIVTEVANVHTNSAVRHTDPVLNTYFLKG